METDGHERFYLGPDDYKSCLKNMILCGWRAVKPHTNHKKNIFEMPLRFTDFTGLFSGMFPGNGLFLIFTWDGGGDISHLFTRKD